MIWGPTLSSFNSTFTARMPLWGVISNQMLEVFWHIMYYQHAHTHACAYIFIYIYNSKNICMNIICVCTGAFVCVYVCLNQCWEARSELWTNQHLRLFQKHIRFFCGRQAAVGMGMDQDPSCHSLTGWWFEHVWTPLKNISQLGWLETQYMGK